MAYKQRPNTGTVFKNDKKTTENHPDGTGSALIEGVEYWVSMWLKKGAKGDFRSLAFTRKDEKLKNKKPDEEIPF